LGGGELGSVDVRPRPPRRAALGLAQLAEPLERQRQRLLRQAGEVEALAAVHVRPCLDPHQRRRRAHLQAVGDVPGVEHQIRQHRVEIRVVGVKRPRPLAHRAASHQHESLLAARQGELADAVGVVVEVEHRRSASRKRRPLTPTPSRKIEPSAALRGGGGEGQAVLDEHLHFRASRQQNGAAPSCRTK
jgi:hypothetical protein